VPTSGYQRRKAVRVSALIGDLSHDLTTRSERPARARCAAVSGGHRNASSNGVDPFVRTTRPGKRVNSRFHESTLFTILSPSSASRDAWLRRGGVVTAILRTPERSPLPPVELR